MSCAAVTSHLFHSLCFLDEIHVDYGKLVKTTAVEGLRVEDLVKQYFQAAEQVRQFIFHLLFSVWI